ncbi:MAG: DUF2208 domain-containing protein [Desulfurococcales archaeon]|nr:DUF2208 domain-containing protein [Desulfurococcales archaeon]
MSYVDNMRSRMLISQVFMILYSILAALLGRGTKTFAIIFILIIIMSLVQSRRGKGPLGKGKTDPEKILSGRKLYEENKTRDIQMKDEKLFEDLQEQSKFTIYMSMGSFIGIGYFILLWPMVDRIYNTVLPSVGNDKLAHFIAFLVFFEGLFIINQLSMLWALKRVGRVTMVNIPQSYVITDRGIVIKGLIGKTGLEFPLPEDIEVRYDQKRGFAELIKHGSRSTTKIRFYARNPKRVYELLKKGLASSSG